MSDCLLKKSAIGLNILKDEACSSFNGWAIASQLSKIAHDEQFHLSFVGIFRRLFPDAELCTFESQYQTAGKFNPGWYRAKPGLNHLNQAKPGLNRA